MANSSDGYVEELRLAGVEALREIGKLKKDLNSLIKGCNTLLNQRNEAIKIAESILHEHEARDTQGAEVILDSYEFLINRDWYPFLDRLKYDEDDESWQVLK